MVDARDDAIGQLLLPAAAAPLCEERWLDTEPRAIANVDWWMKVKEALISGFGQEQELGKGRSQGKRT
jgi:hypothetical protein